MLHIHCVGGVTGDAIWHDLQGYFRNENKGAAAHLWAILRF